MDGAVNICRCLHVMSPHLYPNIGSNPPSADIGKMKRDVTEIFDRSTIR